MIGRNIDDVFKYAPCNVLAVQQDVSVPAKRIVIAVVNPRTANVLLAVGRLLLSANDPHRQITVLHILPPGMSETEKQHRIQAIRASLEQPAFFDPQDAVIPLDGNPITFTVVERTDIVEAIVNQTEEADLLIVGSSQEGWLRRHVIGEKPYRIARRSICPVIMVNQETSRVRFGIQTFFQFFRELEKK